jgi:hypothetical protein
MKYVLVTAVLSASLVQVGTAGAWQADKTTRVNSDAKVLADFTARVKAYDDLRKKADDGAPAMKETNDAAKIKVAQDALANRIMAARANAKRGEIFTPEITLRLRRLLRPEVKDSDTRQLILDDNPGNVKFKVNGPYPSAEPLSTVPPNVLASLPELPPDLEYRFVGKHLILRDSRANLIVDYIANVIA